MKRKCIDFIILLLFACVVLEAAPPRVILVFPLENMSGNANVKNAETGFRQNILLT